MKYISKSFFFKKVYTSYEKAQQKSKNTIIVELELDEYQDLLNSIDSLKSKDSENSMLIEKKLGEMSKSFEADKNKLIESFNQEKKNIIENFELLIDKYKIGISRWKRKALGEKELRKVENELSLFKEIHIIKDNTHKLYFSTLLPQTMNFEDASVLINSYINYEYNGYKIISIDQIFSNNTLPTWQFISTAIIA